MSGIVSNSKAIEIAHELANALAKYSISGGVAESFDTDGNPVITVGADTAGSQSAVIKVFQCDVAGGSPIGFDALGLAQAAYGTTKIQYCTEATAADANTSLLKQSNAEIFLETAKFGTIVEVWLTANGTAPRIPVPATDVLEFTWRGNSLKWGGMAAS